MQTNDSETVKEVTSKAFKCLPDIKQAINELTKLKAVGPATASGIKQLFEKRAHDKGSGRAPQSGHLGRVNFLAGQETF